MFFLNRNKWNAEFQQMWLIIDTEEESGCIQFQIKSDEMVAN